MVVKVVVLFVTIRLPLCHVHFFLTAHFFPARRVSLDPDGQHSVVIKVENFIPKEAEGQLTDEILDEIRVDAISRGSAPKQKEPAKRTAKVSTGISTNSGMYHIHLACHGAAGSFNLKFGSKNGRATVVLEISLPVRLGGKAGDQGAAGQTDKSVVAPTSAHLATSHEPIPEGLKICAIDDSKVIHGNSSIVLSSVVLFGDDLIFTRSIFSRSSAKAMSGS
jgi:hypothetical protein